MSTNRMYECEVEGCDWENPNWCYGFADAGASWASHVADHSRACQATTTGNRGDVFGCIWAEHGEERAHDFGVEYRVYGRRLALHHDAEWLASEVRGLHVQIESLKRDRANDDTAARFRRLLTRLVTIAPANASRKNVSLADVRAAYEEARG